jgi:hypothetical protein
MPNRDVNKEGNVVVDLYTKCVLTVIAAALTALAVHQVIPTANAQAGVTRVQLCDYQNCASLFPFQQTYNGRSYTMYAVPVISAR